MFTHLKRYGIKPAEITIQTDNGTEFTAPWNSLEKTLFTKAIELSFTSTHKKPFPQGLRPIKAMWKVLIGLSKTSFTLAGIFPVL